MDGEYITQTQQERNEGVLRAWFPRWVWNTAANFHQIRKEFLEDGKRWALRDYQAKKKEQRGPAVILGAGPSFNEAAPLLKKWKGAVFSPESMASTCLYHGRTPDYIGVFDAGEMYERFLEGYDWGKAILVTHPSVEEKLITDWKGEKIYYTMHHILSVDYDMLASKNGKMTMREMVDMIRGQTFGADFFDSILPIMYPYVATTILNAGCIANNLIQIANFMGYGPLFLVGVDFGYPNNEHRAEAWQIDRKTGDWFASPTVDIREAIGRAIHISDNGVPTTEEQIEYKIALMSVYRIDKPQLYDCSNGIITELPKVDFKEAVEKHGRGFEKRDFQQIERVCIDYLSRRSEAGDERNVDSEAERIRKEADAGVRQDS